MCYYMQHQPPLNTCPTSYTPVIESLINDIYDSKRPMAKASYQCLKQCLEQGYDIVTSCDIVTNVYYITAKYTDNLNALDALEDIEAIFTILPFDNALLKDAVSLMKKDANYADFPTPL